ncbi:MAG: Stk1 family PASTA domain-containing Ser/Thr kinase [Ilumatobacteraceae bacterium]
MTNNGERTVLNDRYEIQQRIGRGGMADVLLARDLLLDRPVAIKVLFAEFATDPSFVERFRREAQSAAGLTHPNIVGVYDWGKYGGTYFIAMEYVQGRTLADIIRANGRVSAVQAAEIASEVSAALAFAHRNGVVHRDIKPANILIGSSGQVKVADFGIARAVNSAADSNLTQVGLVMGTATYFSPEQAQGAQPDPRSDLYSLGVVMYEMVGGRPPFAGDNPVAIAYKQVHESPQPLNQIAPDVPRPYEAIVAKLLAKNPAVRYVDGEALRDDLRRFRNGEPVRALGAVAGQAASAATGASTGQPVNPNANTVAQARTTVAQPRTATGQVATAGATAAMPRTSIVPTAAVNPSRGVPIARGPYPTGANEAVYYDPPQRRGWWGIAAFLAVVALGVGAFLLFKALNKEETPTKLTLQNMVGKPFQEAFDLLTEQGLIPVLMPNKNADEPVGLVYDTDPVAGVLITKGQKVTLFFRPEEELKSVPDVRGKTQADATSILGAEGFIVADPVLTAVDDSVPVGSVISQSPDAQSMQLQGTAITLTVSVGRDQVPIPDVAGQTADAAESLLTSPQFELVVSRAEEPNDSVPAGAVIRTDPPATTAVVKGSTVALIISTGPTQVSVPFVTGLTETQATQKLTAAGLLFTITYRDVAFGAPSDKRVLEQTPPVGQTVDSSSSVALVVGRALPQPTTTPATTPPTLAPTTTTTTTSTTTPPTLAPTTTAAPATTTATTAVPPGSGP